MDDWQQDPPAIHSVTAAELSQAVELLHLHLEPDERSQHTAEMLNDVAHGRLSSDAILVAKRGGALVGAAAYQVQPGRAAQVWPPRLVASEPAATAERLARAVVARVRREPVRIAYALLEPSTDNYSVVAMQASGLHCAASLVYLVAPAEVFREVEPVGRLTFEPYQPSRHESFAQLLAATYEGTLDCPTLNGVREIHDVLESYRFGGTSHWFVAMNGDEPVGCLLLADHPRQENLELVYMGVVPSARGRGWGAKLVRQAQWIARQSARQRLVLAVDETNWPALAIYQAAGFQVWDQRVCYLAVFDRPC
jgi:ribosomal protein S18 acetylase RimI-like enzyme